MSALETEQAGLTLVIAKDDARVSSFDLAAMLGIDHNDWLNNTVIKYQSDFEEFGVLGFKNVKLNRTGRPIRIALLNEDQSYLALTYSRNSKRARLLKINLIKTFKRFRENQQVKADYLPFYHDMHDGVKSLADDAHRNGSKTPQRVFHMNYNKMINKAMGLASGQRNNLTASQRIRITLASALARDAIEEAKTNGCDHKQAYQHAKTVVAIYADSVNIPHLEVVK